MLYSAQQLTKCVGCGADQVRFWRSKSFAYTTGKKDIRYHIYKCQVCGTGFLNPPPAPDALQEIYAKSGHALQAPVSLSDLVLAESNWPNSTLDGRRMAEGARRRLDASNGKRALDVGAGFGFHTKALLEAGFDVTAINPVSYETAPFQELNGFSPIPTMLEDYRSESEFAVVLMSQVLEHIVGPAAALRQVRGMMPTGGVLVVAVPNFSSFAVRLLGTRDNACLWVPEHVNFFTPKGLKALLSRCGFAPDGGIEWVSRVNPDAIHRRIPRVPRKLSRFAIRCGQVSLDLIVNPAGMARHMTVYARAS